MKTSRSASLSLGIWSGSIAELERLAVPSTETVKRFETEFAKLAAEGERLRSERDAGNARLKPPARNPALWKSAESFPRRTIYSQRALLEIVTGSFSSTPGMLVRVTLRSAPAARRRRWKPLTRRRCAMADLISDRLRREADRVAAHAGFLAETERCISHLCGLDKEIALLEAKAAETKMRMGLRVGRRGDDAVHARRNAVLASPARGTAPVSPLSGARPRKPLPKKPRGSADARRRLRGTPHRWSMPWRRNSRSFRRIAP